MTTNRMTGMALLWLGGMLISAIINEQVFGASEASLFSGIMQPSFSDSPNVLQMFSGFFVVAWEWIQLIFKMLTFDFAFFTGYFVIIRLFFVALSVGIVWGIVSMMRGTSSG